MKVITIPAFSDNYLWLFHADNSDQAFVVDPGDAKPVIAALDQHGLTLAGILITHHHPDHTAGIDALLALNPVPVYGPGGGSVPQVDHPVSAGQAVHLAEGIAFEVLEVPGHTLDHVAYFSAASEALFCGDTLFAGGCGRLFEGTSSQMHQSLQQLASLPANTQVYCAHEYTLANLAFAQAVEPDNSTLTERVTKETQTREKGQPTIPTSIGIELATNPFLRCGEASVKTAAENHSGQNLNSDAEVLAAVRAWKDSF